MGNPVKTAVIAGTSVDTRMGVDYIERKNREAGSRLCEPVCLPVAEDCDAQVRFQYSDEDGKLAVINNIFDRAIEDGISDFFIYCNSLSGAFDFDIYSARKSFETNRDIRIYTPLQVYRKLGGEYSRIGVMAANNLSAHAIEEALMAGNPGIYMIGTGNMAIVRAIEDGLAPGEIAERCGLAHMLKYMEACGAEAIVLGCTHFPYLRETLAELTDLPLIDPADRMFGVLLRAAL